MIGKIETTATHGYPVTIGEAHYRREELRSQVGIYARNIKLQSTELSEIQLRPRRQHGIELKGMKLSEILSAPQKGTYMEPLRSKMLYKIQLKDRTVSLINPINLNVMYQDEQYIATYDKLRLHFFADSLKMAAEGISEEIEMLWEDYVEADVDELSEDAIEFREELISMFNRKDIDDLI